MCLMVFTILRFSNTWLALASHSILLTVKKASHNILLIPGILLIPDILLTTKKAPHKIGHSICEEAPLHWGEGIILWFRIN